MNSGRNQLVLTLARQLQMADKARLQAAFIECEEDGSSIEDRLLKEGTLSDQAHSALCQILNALITTHSGVDSALSAFADETANGEASTEHRHDLSETATQIYGDETRTFTGPVENESSSKAKNQREKHARYRVVAEHARGGLGKVSTAFDQELKREVALKEMQERVATDGESRRRFVAEAEITGQLEHPGVVPVYSLGWNQKGRPFYAMRFIRGSSLKETVDQFHRGNVENTKVNSKESGVDHAIDFQSVEFRKLLGGLIDVCHAMEYAHSRGVLHRDLKPSNVMLGPYGETLVVDWGLAKVQDQSEKNEMRGFIGKTQNPGGSATETELGAIMGTPRFMPPEQAAGDIENLGPTADVYSIGAMLFYVLTGTYSVSNKDPRQILDDVVVGRIRAAVDVSNDVPRPLNAICRKAMALLPKDRYQTAGEIGEEIDRWLADEPVLVHQDSLVVRARRWIRKHSTLATSLAASVSVAFVGLVVGLIVFAGLNNRLEVANVDLKAANELESKLRVQAQTSEAKAIDRKKDADENFELATDSVEKYLTLIDDDLELAQNNFYDLRARLLRTAIPFYEQFIAKRGKDEILDTFHGAAYFRLGAIQADLGNDDLAIQHYKTAQKIFKQLFDEGTSIEEAVGGLARTHNNLGNHLKRLGRTDDAAVELEIGRKMLVDQLAEFPENQNYLNGLAQGLHNLGVLHSDKGDHETAEKLLEKAVETEQELLAAEPENPFYRLLAAKSGNSLAINCFRQNKLDAAIEAYQDALKDSDLLSSEDTHSIERLSIRAGIYQNLGLAKMQSGDQDQARENYEASLKISQELVKAVSRVPKFRSQLAVTHSNLGNLYRSTGNAELSATHQRKSLTVMEQLVEDFPRVPTYRLQLGGTLCNLANSLNQTAPKEAIDRYNRSIAALLPLVEVANANSGEVNTAKVFLRNGYWGKAQTLDREGDYEAASDAYLSASGHADQSLGLSLRANAAYSLAQVGDHKTVTQIAKDLLDHPKPNAYALERGAKAIALITGSANEDDLQEALQRQAIELLTAAESFGHFNDPKRAEDLRSNSDYDSIRSLKEFAELLKRVGK